MIYVKKNFKGIFLILGIVFILIIILFFNKSYAFENGFDSIPDINTISKNNLNLPSKFDLRDVNGINYITPIKNQGSYGLCWAFAGTTAMESSLKKSGYIATNFNEWLSPYQVDALVSPDVKTPSMDYVKTYDHSLGSGEYINGDLGLAYKAFTTGYSPVLMSKFDEKKYTTYYKNKKKYKFYAEDIYNESNSDYYVTDFDILYDVNGNNSSINDLTTIDEVKYYLYNYGGVIVSTIAPSSYCDISTSVCYMKASKWSNGGLHMMTIIGWDNDKQAWILQNSWGESIPYIYLSYDSYVVSYIGIKGISSTDTFDNRYYGSMKSDNSVLYEKIPDNDEKIDSVLVGIKKTGNYNLYISKDGSLANYELVKSFTAYFAGRKSIDLSNENIILNNNNFRVKLQYTDSSDIKDNIYVYTKDLNNTTEEKLYLYTVNDLNSAFQTFTIKYKGFNLDKDRISFKIRNELNQDVTSNFELISSYYLNNYGQLDYHINFENTEDNKEYKVEALYNGNVIDTKSFNVSNFRNFKSGSGTEEDPFIITKAADVEIIASDGRFLSYSYKLGRNIDMTGVEFESIGRTGMGSFSGVFDGNNYTISNLNLNNSKGFFGDIDHAVIKNIKFKDCSISTKDFSGGFVVGVSRSSVIDNIYIDGGLFTVDFSSGHGGFGTLIGSVYLNSTINNIFSSMDIEVVNINNEIYIGGLVGKIYSSDTNDKTVISNSEYAGTINYNNISKFSNIAGILGRSEEDDLFLKNIKLSNEFSIVNSENSSIIGYFIGYISGDYKNLSKSVYYKNDNNFDVGSNTIKVIGNREATIDEYVDIYAFVDIETDESNRYINVNSEKFLSTNTYNLDFDNIWVMTDNGPEIKSLTVDLINMDDSIGETDVYDIDYDNLIISNIKSNSGTITKSEFIDDFISFLGDIYDGNQLVESESAKIRTGMIVKKGDVNFRIAVKGDINDDGKVNVSDIILMRRYLVGMISLEKYQIKAGDLNNDGRIGTTDVINLRRAIAGGYNESCELVWRSC